MALVHISTRPEPILLTPQQISSGLVPDLVPTAPYVPPTIKDLEIFFQPMFDEYLKPPNVKRLLFTVNLHCTTSYLRSRCCSWTTIEENPSAQADTDPFINVFAPKPSFDESSYGDAILAESTQVTQPHNHLKKWSKDHPLDNVISNPSRLVSTRKQLATDALWCLYNSVLSKVKPKNVKTAMDEACWFEAMQEEIHKSDWLQVWELVPKPDCVMITALKWIDKVKLDEYGDVLKNKARSPNTRLSSEEGSLWSKVGSKGVETAMALTAYADADHAGCQDKRRNSPRSGLFQSLYSALTISTHSSLIKPLHRNLSSLPRSGLHHPPFRDNMSHENVPAPTPTRSDDQILPLNAWDGCEHPISVLESYIFDDQPMSHRKELYRPRYIVLQMLWAYKVNHLLFGGRKHNINQRSGSPFNMVEDDHRLGNRKFIPKGEEDEFYGMQIPKELLTNNIKNTPYYNAYLEIVKITAEGGGIKKSTSKADQESIKPSPIKKDVKGKVRKVRKGKSSLHLVNEPDEEQAQPEPEPEPQAKCIFANLPQIPVTGEASIGYFTQLEDDTSANLVCDTPSPIDVETCAKTDKTNSEGDGEILNIGEEQREDTANKVDLEEKNAKINEGQAGSDPGKTPESRPPPERVLMKEDQAGPIHGQSHVALAGPDPEPMHNDFIVTVYPQVHESLKHLDEEHVYLENPLSSTGTLSSMINLDNFTFGDQFIAEKSPEDEPRNANMETKVESMVIVPIHQASSSVPLLSTPIIDLTPPKPVSFTIQEPVYTAITKTITTLPPPPPQQQSTPDPALASHVSVLETVCANFEKKHKLQDKTVQGNSSPMDVRYWLLQSHPDHKALYEALEVSMDHDNQEELHETLTTSRKRRRDDQDPPPPPPTKESKKKSDIREAPSSSSKEKTAPQSKKQVDDIPVPGVENISDSKDTGVVHLLKIKTRPACLKPIPKEDRPKTLELDWVIPLNDLPEHENN
uniref:Gag-Pol polyprotein n=1 Tax=Tanacetum cinerariifolium TaxID=118510 RepID=A0A6L2NL11_TANCI|nr:Gag-Pol polyprotein [Tanacetum cinerariifolium]